MHVPRFRASLFSFLTGRTTALYEASEHINSVQTSDKVKVMLLLCINRPPAVQPVARRYVGSSNHVITAAVENIRPGTPEAVRGIHRCFNIYSNTGAANV
jgi:hypothetical protein